MSDIVKASKNDFKLPTAAKFFIKGSSGLIKKFIAYAFENLQNLQGQNPVSENCIRSIQILQVSPQKIRIIIGDLNPETTLYEKIILNQETEVTENGLNKVIEKFINEL